MDVCTGGAHRVDDSRDKAETDCQSVKRRSVQGCFMPNDVEHTIAHGERHGASGYASPQAVAGPTCRNPEAYSRVRKPETDTH
jgi:hypothetical protein